MVADNDARTFDGVEVMLAVDGDRFAILHHVFRIRFVAEHHADQLRPPPDLPFVRAFDVEVAFQQLLEQRQVDRRQDPRFRRCAQFVRQR